MRTFIIAAAVAVLTVCGRDASAQHGITLDQLAGAWSAPPLEVRLNSDFDVSVWGPNATSVRKIELTLRPAGEGAIKVTRSVVDAQGRPKKGSVSVEEAQLRVRLPDQPDPRRLELGVEVVKPERRYLDDPNDRFALDGLGVQLVATDLEHGRLNVRFDLPDGRGSFGETLTRQAPARAARPGT